MKKSGALLVAFSLIGVITWWALVQQESDRMTTNVASEKLPQMITGSDVGRQFASSEAVLLPEPVQQNANAQPASVSQVAESLWQPSQAQLTAEIDGIPVTYLQTDTDTLEQLQVGHQLELVVPELNQSFKAKIESTHNQLADVQVWRGPVVGGAPSENIIITRGKKETYVMLSSLQGAYTVRIDNISGESVMVNETYANPGLGNHDDLLIPESTDSPLPVREG